MKETTDLRQRIIPGVSRLFLNNLMGWCSRHAFSPLAWRLEHRPWGKGKVRRCLSSAYLSFPTLVIRKKLSEDWTTRSREPIFCLSFFITSVHYKEIEFCRQLMENMKEKEMLPTDIHFLVARDVQCVSGESIIDVWSIPEVTSRLWRETWSASSHFPRLFPSSFWK